MSNTVRKFQFGESVTFDPVRTRDIGSRAKRYVGQRAHIADYQGGSDSYRIVFADKSYLWARGKDLAP
jgi:hypothetical protein